MDQNQFLSNADIGFVDQLYTDYKADRSSVSPEWQRFFEGFELGQQHGNGSANGAAVSDLPADAQLVAKENYVVDFINAYRSRGHLFANINPILPRRQFRPPITLEDFRLSEADLDMEFHAGNLLGLGKAKLRDIKAFLETTYCRTIGAEYRYIRIPDIVMWLEEKMEGVQNQPSFNQEQKLHILRMLGKASFFENFIHRKFPGQKRFSLEGGEAIIPALDELILVGSDLGVQEFVIGMAHRGRLNILTNIMRKEPDNVFGEFKDKGVADSIFDGDVKYHLGHSSDPELKNGKTVHLSMAPNPSHLETVNPVVEGITRAKMEQLYENDSDRICPILIHGDASLAGQGVVYEVIQMSRLPGYQVGGTVHFVINNQIGFTTSQEEGRSSTYCTDVAKVTLSPVFHVNGDDPEAVAYVTKLAMEFRQRFKRDVFVDILCYRRYGHNEGDEPRFTQPVMYEAISKHKGPYEIYKNVLLEAGEATAEQVKALEKELTDYYNEELDQATEREYALATKPTRMWDGFEYYNTKTAEEVPVTGFDQTKLHQIAERISTEPKDFPLHRNIQRLLKQRREMVTETNALDWGMAEHLAFGSLLLEGRNVRLSGQDSERGTFSHRHSVLVNQNNNQKYIPLNNLSDGQGKFMVMNSLLSEYGVMGFETGYSMSAPNGLTIWEAQFGDFVNGAQIIIDQFLSSMTTKWQRLCGLVLLLPHGHEGQGPEHSSARIERFLELCALNNMYVTNCTTPANLFHVFRRQLHGTSRRPLVVFTPKSLLRHKRCVSPLEDFAENSKFQPVIDDPTVDPKQVKRVVLCSGKVYYDLLEAREQFQKHDVALIRLEQLYPFPRHEVYELLEKKYKAAKVRIWCQEEPLNMGPWTFILRNLRDKAIDGVGRKDSPSPATGSKSQHLRQQEYILKKTLDLDPKVTIFD